MTATARAKQNRVNAQHSTGPKTPEGKAASSQNARKHGLSGRLLLANRAEKERFEQRIEEIQAFYQLANPLARAVIEALVIAEFRRNQAFEAEQNVLMQLKLKVVEGLEETLDDETLDGLARAHDVETTKLLTQLSRHYNAADRSWHRHYKALKEMKAAEEPAAISLNDMAAIQQAFADYLQNEPDYRPPAVTPDPEDRAA